VALLYNTAGCCIFDAGNDNVTEICISSGGTAHYTDAKELLCAGIVSHFKSVFLSYHSGSLLLNLFCFLHDLAESPSLILAFSSCFLLFHGCCLLLNLFRFLHDLDESPSLILAQRSRLHNLYGIADAALVVLVVSLQLVGLLYNLLVTGMLSMLLDRNHDGLI